MTDGPVRQVLGDGRRRHFQHGPIDLVIEAFGPEQDVAGAYEAAWRRFQSALDELVDELPLLRRPVGDSSAMPGGRIARRMWRACRPYSGDFVTPMAAVAGAVADEILAAMVSGPAIERGYVNDGGDIALHLSAGQIFDVGIVGEVERPAIDGHATIGHHDPIRGIATSGRSGRSFSLGIADSVTVLAADAASADAAATLIGNAVDVDHSRIERRPAVDLDPDSDLGGREVTVAVGTLDEKSIRTALNRGALVAMTYLDRGLIAAALLTLQGRRRVVGALPSAIGSDAGSRAIGRPM